MPSYPTLRTDADASTDEQTAPAQTFIAGDGKGRVYWPASAKRFKLRHHALTLAQTKTLMDFYTANRLLTFDLPWKAGEADTPVTYQVRFASRPAVRPYGKADPRLRNVDVDLVEV